MTDCPNCGTQRQQVGGKCFVCGYTGVETTEAVQEHETTAAKRPARKATAEKR